MKKKVISIALTTLSLFGSLWANLEVSVQGVKSDGAEGQVQLKLRNGFDQGIQSARVWIFMFDEDGKVAGNQSQWLFGGKGQAEEQLTSAAEQSYTLKVQAERPFKSAQVTFSRIIMADGSMPNPQTSVVEGK